MSRFSGKAHAFVDDLDRPSLRGEDRHHLERVLRLRAGDEITVSDGRGGWRPCRFGPELEPLGPIGREARARPDLAVGFALVKGDRPELVVQKLTELGIDRIVPFEAARSVVRWDTAKAARAHERLTAIAREAAMQSRCVWLPDVEPLRSFAEVAGPSVALCERGGERPSLARPTVLVGPEGGWASEELTGDRPTVGLGETVLRAETAAVAAAAILAGLRARIVVEPLERHAE